MIIFPAIDLIGGNAVRLTRGDYSQMTEYSADPLSVARSFAACGARYLHAVDLEGARDGGTPNRKTVERLITESGLSIEIGGGIRSMDTVKSYIDAGVWRVILGTAALEDPEFLAAAVSRYGDRIAVGVDLRDGLVSVRGWLKTSDVNGREFCRMLADMGVVSIICTDISKDGAMSGTNETLYAELAKEFPRLKITASGGISELSAIRRLADLGLYGAILGKALYTGDISLSAALKEAGDI